MTEFDEIKSIVSIQKIIEEYRIANREKLISVSKTGEVFIIDLARYLSTYIFDVERMRIETHKNWSAKVFELRKEGKSVAESERESDNLYPELYGYRRLLEASYENLSLMRSHISWIKAEKNEI